MSALQYDGLRTRAAKLAAAADALKRESARAAPFSLAFMTDAARAPNPELIARTLPRGAAIILRDYAEPKRAALAHRLRAIAKARGVFFLVGADVALARFVGADGVHLPSWAKLSDATAPNAGELIVSCACHDGEDLARAAAMGADLAFLSPVFATASHPDAKALGAEAFSTCAAGATLPVLALGGIDERNADRLAGPNVAGFGAINAFLAR